MDRIYFDIIPVCVTVSHLIIVIILNFIAILYRVGGSNCRSVIKAKIYSGVTGSLTSQEPPILKNTTYYFYNKKYNRKFTKKKNVYTSITSTMIYFYITSTSI